MANRWPTLRRFLERLAADHGGENTKSTIVVRDFYIRCKDPGARTKGLDDLRKELDQIGKFPTLSDLAHSLGALRASGLGVLVSLTSYWEAREANGPTVARVGLTNPELDRAHYGAKHPLVGELRAHWQRLAALSLVVTVGDIDAAQRIDSWLAASPDPDDGDPGPTAPALTRASALKRARFPWGPYLEGLGLSSTAPILPASADTLDRIDRLAQLPLADLKSYVRVRLMEGSANLLPQAFVEEEKRFHDEIVKESEHASFEIGSVCGDLTIGVLGPWVAQSYLSAMADRSSEEAARGMFILLRTQFINLVQAASWMDGRSRQAAIEKITRTIPKFIGDIQTNGLETVVLQPGSLRGALIQLATQRNRELFADIGRPSAPPQLYPSFDGAMYSSLVNAVWVSPELARPPYIRIGIFDPPSFGAFGTLVGHELAHALSPTGRRYDTAGLLRETWSSQAVAAFDTRVDCLERQLDDFVRDSKNKLDGHLTVDEHVGDLVGVELAFGAMEAGRDRSANDRAAQDRRRDFFLAYAQQECGWSDDLDVQVDESHAPARARINAVLSNLPAFARTFQCPPGAAMSPHRTCSLW